MFPNLFLHRFDTFLTLEATHGIMIILIFFFAILVQANEDEHLSESFVRVNLSEEETIATTNHAGSTSAAPSEQPDRELVEPGGIEPECSRREADSEELQQTIARLLAELAMSRAKTAEIQAEATRTIAEREQELQKSKAERVAERAAAAVERRELTDKLNELQEAATRARAELDAVRVNPYTLLTSAL